MAMMALFNRIQSLSIVNHLLLVLLLRSLTVFAITSVSFYPDPSCEGTSFNATEASIAYNGPCDRPGATAKSLIATVLGESQQYGCTVTVYSDPYCSNDAKAASLGGTCTTFAFTVQSYSVDCMGVNGTTTIIDASSGTSDSSTPAAATTRSSHALSSNPTNTSTSSNSNSNTNLSRNGEIVIGVVIPCVAIIVAILLGIDQRRRFRRGENNVFNFYYTHGDSRNGTRPHNVSASGRESTASRVIEEHST